MPHDKQLKIAYETLYLYAPLAHRLGLYVLKTELEDLSLKYTEPEVYQNIAERLKESEKERNRFINKFILPIKKTLSEQEMKFTILARTKSIHSIWEKMKKKEIPFEEVFDLFAIRIVIDSLPENEKSDCWKAYSIITDFYTPNPDRLRDWISTPKGNGYESLHTTVMSDTGRWVEVQIRSVRMDAIAEKGYAAHWKYKDIPAGGTAESGLDEWLNKIRELLKSPESNALDFIEDFKLNLFSDEIFVFTPKGEMKSLPKGSTALDFAYNIHSQIGNNCIGAKVNHRLVPLSYPLKSGDQIEVITSVKQKPKEEWLNFVTTARAKSRIKVTLKEERKLLGEEGKEILEKKLKQAKMEYNNSTINKLMNYFSCPTLLDLYCEVAEDRIGLKELKTYVQETEKSRWLRYLTNPFSKSKDKESEKKTFSQTIVESLKNKPETLVIGDNQDELDYTLSDCCNPIPGDDVFGFITVDGIKIHRSNCSNAMNLMSKYAYRVVKAKWTSKESIEFLSGIKIIGIDKVGLVHNVTKVISNDLNVNIRSISFDSNDGTFEGTVMVFVHDTQHLHDLIHNLKKINGVEKVFRLDRNE